MWRTSVRGVQKNLGVVVVIRVDEGSRIEPGSRQDNQQLSIVMPVEESGVVNYRNK